MQAAENQQLVKLAQANFIIKFHNCKIVMQNLTGSPLVSQENQAVLKISSMDDAKAVH